MTPLKPIENYRVKGVMSDRYPLNKISAHPESSEPATDAHHCFPRSQIGNDSWFVEIEEDNGQITLPIPHVVGLSREEHERIERHDAWIKLEDGVWNWYDRQVPCLDGEVWILVGPLNPQPGSVEGKPKTRKRFKGDERRKRRTISIRVPNDTENGGEIWDKLLEEVFDRLIDAGLYDEGSRIPVYEALVAALRDWLNEPALMRQAIRDEEAWARDSGNA